MAREGERGLDGSVYVRCWRPRLPELQPWDLVTSNCNAVRGVRTRLAPKRKRGYVLDGLRTSDIEVTQWYDGQRCKGALRQEHVVEAATVRRSTSRNDKRVE